MRRLQLAMTRAAAEELLARASVVHLASTGLRAQPILRCLDFVLLDGELLFHGAQVGEKVEAVDRPAVAAAEEVVTRVPSYWIDPELACPATTLYRSVHAKGVLYDVTDPVRKCAMLEAMMLKYQPEGGYASIRPDDPRYTKMIRATRVIAMKLELVAGKAKLGQHKPSAYVHAVVTRLWQRGRTGDDRAIETILEANPRAGVPAFLNGPSGLRLVARPRDDEAEQAAELLSGEYWVDGLPQQLLAAAHVASAAWVGARDAAGKLVGSARAISDAARHAHLADVVVHREHRGRGLGTALFALLLDHPAVRGAALVRLGTADRQRFYAKFGFVEAEQVDLGFRSTAMLRLRR